MVLRRYRTPVRPVRHLSKIALLACSVVLASCTAIPVQHFDGATPGFDPIVYFDGPTHSWGVIETRDGAPKTRFRANLSGRREGETLVLTQDFIFDDGHRQQRIWHLRRIDAHRLDATASDVIGVAAGYAYGNAFRWDYTLQLKPGKPLSRVQMHHWMYLAGDGITLLNQVTIRKFGLRVGGATEYFQRGNAVMPGVGASAAHL